MDRVPEDRLRWRTGFFLLTFVACYLLTAGFTVVLRIPEPVPVGAEVMLGRGVIGLGITEHGSPLEGPTFKAYLNEAERSAEVWFLLVNEMPSHRFSTDPTAFSPTPELFVLPAPYMLPGWVFYVEYPLWPLAPLGCYLIWRRRLLKRWRPDRCPWCGYDTTATDPSPCPECGRSLGGDRLMA